MVIRVKIIISELLYFTIQVPHIESLLQIRGRCSVKICGLYSVVLILFFTFASSFVQYGIKAPSFEVLLTET